MAPRGSPEDPKVTALRESRCLNPHPGQVTDPAFLTEEFFDARDAVQVKYEMVRAVTLDGAPVTATAAAFGYSQAVVLPGRRRPGGLRPGRPGAGQARAPRGPQAHRADPGLGRGAAGRRYAAEGRRPGRSHRRGIRGARAPPLRGAGAGPPPGAPQKPLTHPPATAGRRTARPCPCDLHLATRLLNRAPIRMPARPVLPAAGWTPATSSCVMPRCTHAPPRSRSGSACSPARASPPGGAPWPAWPPRPPRARREQPAVPPARPGGVAAARPGGRRARPHPGRRRRRAGRHLSPLPHPSIPPAPGAGKEHPPVFTDTASSKVTAAHLSRQAVALRPAVEPQAGPAQHRVRGPPVRPARQGGRARLGQRPGHRHRHRPGPLRRLRRRPGRLPAAGRRGIPRPGRDRAGPGMLPPGPQLRRLAPAPGTVRDDRHPHLRRRRPL